ncbi:AAA family ATPase [Vibrio aestuarianus]|uniref:ATP-dependent RecD-like DNA helicase n=1 Tax=Vibrio aestuarianus TaxID=28171 RepID=A0A9X4EYS7_9VIBR|nr:AAA family ATPase [Vibrio aestuarianus]MDE1244011.1 ATP-dependent RecD-like DNA helicase [Vibrio aestuarianus]
MKLEPLKTSNSVIEVTGIITSILNVKVDGQRCSAIFRIKSEKETVRVVCSFGTITEAPSTHDLWSIKGKYQLDDKYGEQLIAAKAVRRTIDIDTSQELVCEYLAQNPAFSGIGITWAQKLNQAFPNRLIEILSSTNADYLSSHPELKMPLVLAESLLLGWRHCSAKMKLIEFLDKKKIPKTIASKLINLLGDRVINRLEENPYLLFVFFPVKNALAQWKKVDVIAQQQFLIQKNDVRRAISLVEVLLYEAYDIEGHTALPVKSIQKSLIQKGLNYLVSDLIIMPENQTLMLHEQKSLVQNVGHFAIEKMVDRRLNNIVTSSYNHPINFNIKLLREYEVSYKLKSGFEHFAFDDIQVEAVKFVTESRLSVVSGGAGVGKTTIISAILYQHQYQNVSVWLLAPTGKAACRLTEETGKKAETVFSFVLQMKQRIRRGVLSEGLIIIDEASMLDIPHVYSMLKLLPRTFRLCLVGDVKQLEPVGPGLVFHQLAVDRRICVSLSRPYRQGKDSDLQRFCDAVGKQDFSEAQSVIHLMDFETFQLGDNEVVLYQPQSLSDQSMCKAALDIWYEKKGSGAKIQILAATRNMCQMVNQERQRIRAFRNKNQLSRKAFGQQFIKGDPVIYGRNDKDIGISNGSIGKIIELFDIPKYVDNRECILKIEFEDEGIRYLTESECLYLDLAYCITTHKSQGSQYDEVIVVLDSDYLIDNSWLYTAVSRACCNVALIGSYKLVEMAIKSLPNANHCHIGHPILIQAEL